MLRYSIATILMCVALFICIGCGEQPQTVTPSSHKATTSAIATPSTTVNATNPINTPTTSVAPSTGTKSTTPNANISSTVIFFYGALESKNYRRAYSFLGNDAMTADGQHLSWSAFLLLCQSFDKTEGVINDFSFIADATAPTNIIMTITRASDAHYHAHVNLKQENGAWKIVQLDRI